MRDLLWFSIPARPIICLTRPQNISKPACFIDIAGFLLSRCVLQSIGRYRQNVGTSDVKITN